jgi:predicted transglutaminase-like cysteine proteinase
MAVSRGPPNYGADDYWASPLEFLRNSGDCEDYAIIAYVTLKTLGFDIDSLRFVVLHDKVRDEAHAVLAVYLDDKIYTMDSLVDGVLTQDRFQSYVPQYSVNETTLWAHIVPTATTVDAAASLIR